MSIIFDALKKVEKKLHSTPKPTNEPPVTKVHLKNHPGKKIFFIIILLFLLALAMILIKRNLFISVTINSPINTAAPATSRPFSKDIPKPESPEKIDPSKTDTPTKTIPTQPFVLNGVFFSEDCGYALINNQIVRQGDEVDGAQVVRITPEMVEINFQGNSILLKTNK